MFSNHSKVMWNTHHTLPCFETSEDIYNSDGYSVILFRFVCLTNRLKIHRPKKEKTRSNLKPLLFFLPRNKTLNPSSLNCLFLQRRLRSLEVETGHLKCPSRNNLIFPEKNFSCRLQIRGSSFLWNEWLPYLFLQETGCGEEISTLTCCLKRVMYKPTFYLYKLFITTLYIYIYRIRTRGRLAKNRMHWICRKNWHAKLNDAATETLVVFSPSKWGKVRIPLRLSTPL